MSDLRKAAQQALEALEAVDNDAHGTSFPATVSSAITDLRDALAEPVQEPVAGAVLNADGRPVLVRNGLEDWYCKERNARRLYTAPQPQRPPLTDEEMLGIIDDAFEGASLLDVVRAVERKVRGE